MSDWIGSLIGSTANLIGNKMNYDLTRQTNQANIEAQYLMNMQQQDYARAMTQAQWERDDNAHQREVNDLIKAGLSPLASTSGAPVTSAMDWNPESMAVQQAPQVDFNGLTQSMLQMDELSERRSEHRDKMLREDRSLDLQAEKLSNEVRSLDIQDQHVKNEAVRISNDYQLACDELAEKKREFDKATSVEEKKELAKELAYRSEKLNERIKDSFDKEQPIKKCESLADYNRAMEQYGKDLVDFYNLLKEPKKAAKSFGINLGLYHGDTGGNIGFNKSSQINQKFYEDCKRKWNAEHPLPYYVDYYEVFSKDDNK